MYVGVALKERGNGLLTLRDGEARVQNKYLFIVEEDIFR